MTTNVPIDIPLSEMAAHGCRRCRKPFTVDEPTVIVQQTPKVRNQKSAWRPIVSGQVLMTMALYHERCLPPTWFHQLAGSRPAKQSSDAVSLRDEHAASEGSPID